MREGIDNVFAEFTGEGIDFDLQSVMEEAKAAGANVMEDQRATERRNGEGVETGGEDQPAASA